MLKMEIVTAINAGNKKKDRNIGDKMLGRLDTYARSSGKL